MMGTAMFANQKLQCEEIKLREADQAAAEPAEPLQPEETLKPAAVGRKTESAAGQIGAAEDPALKSGPINESASKGKAISNLQAKTGSKNGMLIFLLQILALVFSAFCLAGRFNFSEWAQSAGIDYMSGLALCALPWQIVWTIWQLKINNKIGEILKRPGVVSAWEIILVSCFGFFNQPFFIHGDSSLQDPFMWIWSLSLFWFYLRVAPAVFADKGGGSAFRHGLLLGCLANAFIPISLLVSGVLVPAASSFFESRGINGGLTDVSSIVVFNSSTAMAFQTVALSLLSLWLHRLTKERKGSSTAGSAKLVSTGPRQISVALRPFAGVERWIQRTVRRKGRSLAEYMLLSFALPVAFVLYLCWWFSPIPRDLGILLGISNPALVCVQETDRPDVAATATQGKSASHAVKTKAGTASEEAAYASAVGRGLIAGILGMLAALGGAAWFYYLSRPTALVLGQNGIALKRRRGSFSKEDTVLDWREVGSIELSQEPAKSLSQSRSIVFRVQEGRSVKIPLAEVDTMEQRQGILEGIQTYACGVRRDAALVETLQPPSDRSYTELWLQALSAPPKRERMKPLENGVSLREQRYTVDETLGVGGQGHAYLAVDHENNCRVVLKEFILPVYVDVDVRKSALQQFENEARILQNLSHPQIVKLQDFFIEDQRAYLVLEHIEGASLRELVDRQGAFTATEARHLCEQMCDILQCLHGQLPPVVHRDFTPDNLILSKDGLLKLIDFNVARQVERASLGTIVGKHAYMPPEQFRGETVVLSDIYALGASLFFLLTGSDPEPISCSRIPAIGNPESELLSEIVEKTTCLETAERIQTAAEIRKLLNDGHSGSADQCN
jgi:tRNA A-37 threonylcarbamoyl transferase component Bud32